MLNAIGSAGFVTPGVTGNTSTGSDLQLDRYKVQLSDWVHCDSCNTAEGKAKIQELSDKIAAIERKTKASEAQKQATTEIKPAPSSTGPLGSRVNDYA